MFVNVYPAQNEFVVWVWVTDFSLQGEGGTFCGKFIPDTNYYSKHCIDMS